MECTLRPAGARVAGLWLFLAGLLAAGLLWLLFPLLALIFEGLWALALCYFMGFWCPSVQVQATGGELVVRAGRLFPMVRRIPLRALCGVTRYDSPLMRAAGCCTLVLFASGGLFCFLPGLAPGDADFLCRLLREG